MAYTEFVEKLKDKNSAEHAAMLSHVHSRAEKSRCDMAKHYETWDEHDRVFRSIRPVDKEDENSTRKGAPKKMIVPFTFAQIMTFVSFNVMSITQNERFYELEPTGTEDNPLDEPMELILERDLRKNQWNPFLIQFFLDIGRFSLAAAEVCYVEEYRKVRVPQQRTRPQAFVDDVQETVEAFVDVPSFVGNRVYPVSPYRFLPDTSLPLTRYQEGEFCGSEDVFSLSSLRAMGDALMNLDQIDKYTEESYKKRLSTSRVDLGVTDRTKNPNLLGFGTEGDRDSNTKVTSGSVVVTKMVIDIIPKYFHQNRPNFEALGDEDFQVRYMVWIGNDNTIIRFEEANYLHCMFPYIAAQYLPDQHHIINQSLADICQQITELVTWKLNAHVAAQKNSVESKWIVDPAGIDVRTLESRSPYVFLKKTAANTDVRRYMTQFITQDTTGNVMSDIEGLKSILEGVTGNSAQMQGQYSSGRRSATQDRVVAQGAGSRGKTLISGIWDTAFEPLGKQLIANNRQEMDFDTFQRIMGQREWPVNYAAPPQVDPTTGQPIEVRYTTEEIFTMFKSDAVGIASSEDFFVFDGTQPSEKAFLAQSLQEILSQVMANPEFAAVLGFGPEQMRELFKQIYVLRGVTPARLPTSTVTAPVPSSQQDNGRSDEMRLKVLATLIPQLEGDERKQALAMLGIKADNSAHEKRLRLEHPSPASKSNGTRS